MFKIQYKSMEELSKPEKKQLYDTFAQQNEAARKLVKLYTIVIFALSLFGITVIINQLIKYMPTENFFANIYPALLFVFLFYFYFCIRSMKKRGYVGALVCFLSTLAVIFFCGKYYIAVFLFATVPAFFVLRCLVNYNLYSRLKKEQGFPGFNESQLDIQAKNIYVNPAEAFDAAEDNYAGWNAFGSDSEDAGQNKE